jgi:hypothetical protein
MWLSAAHIKTTSQIHSALAPPFSCIYSSLSSMNWLDELCHICAMVERVKSSSTLRYLPVLHLASKMVHPMQLLSCI